MSDQYVGEIRIFAGNFAPMDWSFCDGSLLAISQNPTLYQLIGTTYGGDGINTFGLPNLLSRVPIHQGIDGFGNPYTLAQNAGEEQVQLSVNQIPSHSHPAQCSTDPGTAADPTGVTWAACSSNQYSGSSPNTTMNGASTFTGGNQAHFNLMPYLAITFIIALFGIFPSQN